MNEFPPLTDEPILRDIIWVGTRRQPPMNIIGTVAARHGLTLEEIRGPLRFTQIAHARHEAMWELRQRTNMSLPRIASFFNRDHTTVLAGIRAHERRSAEGRAHQ